MYLQRRHKALLKLNELDGSEFQEGLQSAHTNML